MKKVGIITFHFADNFGAVLQAYALSETLKEYNLDVEVIDFCPKGLVEPYTLFLDIKESIKNRGTYLTIRAFIKRIVKFRKNYNRISNFNDFRQSYLNLSNKKYLCSEDLINNPPIYDYYITGSDQVWNPNFFSLAGYSYFLDFTVKDSIKISYAASIAQQVVDEKYHSIYSEQLIYMDYISVRENRARDLLSKLTNKKIDVTLDPTLLIEMERWNKILKHYDKKYKYVLVYDLVSDPLIIKVANKIAEETGWKIISYSKNKNYINWVSEFETLNPTQFLGLIKNAEFIITSSFHGTAFSLIFNKPFYTILDPTRGSRMVDLLNSLNLENRIIRSFEDVRKIDYELPYDDVNIKLSNLRKKSLDFLKYAMEINIANE